MFKKIEIWILYIVILVFIVFSFVPSFILYLDFAYDKQVPLATPIIRYIVDIPIKVNQLLSKRISGYEADAQFNEKIISKLKKSNQNHIGHKYSKPMYLLSSRYDFELSQTVIDIVDLNTFILKKKIIPDFEFIKSNLNPKNIYMEKSITGFEKLRSQSPHITHDGGIVFQARALVKLKNNGQIDWVNSEKNFHHSLTIDHEGNIWSPSRTFPFTLKNINHRSFFKEDAITCISSKGKIIFDRSLVDIFFKNEIGYKIYEDHAFKNLKKDPFHLNDIEPVLEDGRHWKKGDLFLSLRGLSMIMLYRPSNDSILWYSEGKVRHQHDIDIIGDGKISIFNNESVVIDNNAKKKSNNKITIYDFDSKTFSNYFENSTEKYNVRTRTQGLHTLLDDGALYIEETDNGRHLFFDSSGQLVWQIFNYSSKENLFYQYGWSSLIYKKNEIDLIRNFIK